MNNSDQRAKHRILVIDDTPGVLEDFRKILCLDRASNSQLEAQEFLLFGESNPLKGQSEFQIDFARQGQEGMARVFHAIQEGCPYELVFLDVRMPPGWDGIEVAPRLLMADPDLFIVICTAYSDYTWEEMFARLGGSDRVFFLKKPFERIEVLQFAHSLTKRRSRKDDGRSGPPHLEESGRKL